ncbi:MAG: restriction endonuclease subunit S [Actinobacteria bacterium]|nr:restriction endonuclease subunit S [Actinomycetota bacterium]
MKVEWVPLREVMKQSREPVAVEPTSVYRSAGLLNRGRGLFKKPDLSGANTTYKHLYRLNTNQVVYSKLFGWEGAIAVVGEAFANHFVSSEFPIFDVEEEVIALPYLEHFLLSGRFAHELARATTGLGQRRQRVNVDQFLILEAPLVARSDQERIAAHLSSLGVVATASRHAARIEPESLLTRAVMHVAAGQPQRSLGELLERSRPWIQLDQSSTYRPIGVRGFGRGMIRYPETDADALSKLRYFAVKPGSLIVSNIKAWEGAVCTARESDDGRIGSNRFLQYTVKDPAVTVEWIERYLLTPEGVALLSAASPGSADRNRTLSMEGFERILIPVPPIAAQRSIGALANTVARAEAVRDQRDVLAAALLPAARNEIFNAMR